MLLRAVLPLALVLACGAAHAQLRKAPSPEGAWTFETDKIAYGCALHGDMRVKEAAANAFSCNFTAIWTCETRLPHSVKTEQTCIATQAGADLVMTSAMKAIISVDPPDMLKQMQQRYAADSFAVTISPIGDEMTGLFKSYSQAPVKFRRKLDLLS
jgi:hypothetical protein